MSQIDSVEISPEFRANTLKNHLDETGFIAAFPSKEKKKLVLLQVIINDFKADQLYSEQEVNEQLKKRHSDFVAVRRYLIEYGFLERTKDGKVYWLI